MANCGASCGVHAPLGALELPRRRRARSSRTAWFAQQFAEHLQDALPGRGLSWGSWWLPGTGCTSCRCSPGAPCRSACQVLPSVMALGKAVRTLWGRAREELTQAQKPSSVMGLCLSLTGDIQPPAWTEGGFWHCTGCPDAAQPITLRCLRSDKPKVSVLVEKRFFRPPCPLCQCLIFLADEEVAVSRLRARAHQPNSKSMT